MSIGRICNRVIVTADPDESVRDAARRMAQKAVGTLVVVRGERPVGILTDRDIVVRAMANDRDPDVTPVSEIMTTPIRSLDESTPIEDALSKMASAGPGDSS